MFEGDKPVSKPEKRGLGRPIGAMNKKSDQLRLMIAHKHGRTPAEELAVMAFQDEDDIIAELKLTGKKARFQARRYRIGLLKALLPYTHQKLPTIVEMSDERHITLVLGEVGVSTTDGQAVKPGLIDLRPANEIIIEQKQRLKQMPDDKSDKSKSDARR